MYAIIIMIIIVILKGLLNYKQPEAENISREYRK